MKNTDLYQHWVRLQNDADKARRQVERKLSRTRNPEAGHFLQDELDEARLLEEKAQRAFREMLAAEMDNVRNHREE